MSNLKQRNLAVLAAVAALGILIFTITVIRIQEGTAKKMEAVKTQHAEQPQHP